MRRSSHCCWPGTAWASACYTQCGIDHPSQLQENEALASTSGSTKLVAIAAADAEASAKEAFAPILQRQEEANAVQQKLLLLQRFEALFRMPGRVAQLASTRDFEGVVAEYCKGKKLIPVKDHALWAEVSSRLEAQVTLVFVCPAPSTW